MENNKLEPANVPGENKLGVMPIGKLLFNMSLPLMVSMLLQALYNVVDTLYVARVSDTAMTAITYVFPINLLMIAVSVGTGVGVNAILSKRLGEKNYDEANHIAGNAIVLLGASWIIFAVFGMFCSEWFMSFFSSDPYVIENGAVYLRISTVFGFGVFIQIAFERILQASGHAFQNMLVQGTGALINIILDPIFIFGLDLGIAGAAIATVTGQIIAMILGFFINRHYNRFVSIKLRHLKLKASIVRDVYRVGIPSVIMQSVGTVMLLGMNWILRSFPDTAAPFFGIYFKMQSFITMPTFGLTNALVPIVAFNYGAKNRKRITSAIKLSLKTAVCIMAFGLIIFQIFPRQILLLFNASDAMLEVGVPALRIISISFTMAGFGIVLSSVFQALGNGVFSMILSICRQLAVLLPAAYILFSLFGMPAIWASFPISELVSVGLSIVMYRYIYRKIIVPLGAAERELSVPAELPESQESMPVSSVCGE